MGSIPDFVPSVSNLLEVLQEEGIQVPVHLIDQINTLKRALLEALLQNYEPFKSTLENLLPSVWNLRMEALPILVEMDLTEAMKNVELEVSMLPEKHPALSDVVERLHFGLLLMAQLTQSLLEQNSDAFNQAISDTTAFASYESVITELKEVNDSTSEITINFLHGSLLMELLILCAHTIADEQLTIDPALYYELKYQSALAVEEYAGILGLDHTKMPWYKSPQNYLQHLLLEGPTLSESDLKYIHEKQTHLNSWK